jgi:hypothetical protein
MMNWHPHGIAMKRSHGHLFQEPGIRRLSASFYQEDETEVESL